MHKAFGGVFEDMTILITGHTGFKGSWLSLWLQELGAKVIGYSLPPISPSNNYEVSHVSDRMISLRGDIRDFDHFKHVLEEHQPQLIFHLAAQPIVLHSFKFPKKTFDVNVGGTVNVLEASLGCPSVRAVVMITSDKCYENKEWIWGYRENDALGGTDPYSASKSMAEQAIAAYRISFCSNNKDRPAIASARAGNVIGGGDFSDARVIPDTMRALMAKELVRVRNPRSIRPWLNVLDPLSGYLSLAWNLLNEGERFAEPWNFGPIECEAVDVQSLVEKAIVLWGEGDWLDICSTQALPETGLLRLNWDKAANRLHWRPIYTWVEAIQQTVDWFKAFETYSKKPSSKDMREVCVDHISRFTQRARQLGVSWSSPKRGICKLLGSGL